MNPHPFLFSVLYLLTSFSFAQNKIDSLQNLLQKDKTDTSRINLLNALCWEYRLIGEYDFALYYGNEALTLFSRHPELVSGAHSTRSNEMLKPTKQVRGRQVHHDAVAMTLLKGQSTAYKNIGLVYWEQGDYPKALDYYFQSLKISEEIENKNGIAAVLGNIGLIYHDQADYPKALDYYFKALKMDEELGNKNGIAKHLGNIGLVYWNQADYSNALDYYFKALKINEELGKKNGIAIQLGNIGLIYHGQADYPKALEYYFKALKIDEELGNKNGIARHLGNIGNVYHQQADYPKVYQAEHDSLLNLALEYYFKSLKINEELGRKSGITIQLGNIGTLYTKQKKYKEAEEYLLKSFSIAKEIGSLDDVKVTHQNLSKLFVEKGEYKKAYEHHQQYSIAKDSIFSEESNKQITEMQTKYETEKKEQQIKLLNKDKEIQSKDLERQKTIRNAVTGGLLLVLFFSFVLINRLLLIRKQKKVIEIEREKSEKLLLNILPKETADELKHKNTVTPKHYDMVTVMFTDFKGFTTIAEKMSAEELVSELDFIFKKFDEIISKYPIEKIKTIGDAYMCAGGLPVANTTNPVDVVLAALEICEFMKSRQVAVAVGSEEKGLPLPSAIANWQIRIGVHTGSVIAGVVGDKKFAYDIWGDTVNIASRMESSGEAGKVNISGATYKLLVGRNDISPLRFTFRGKIPAKNKGEIEMYFVDKE